MDFMDLVNQRYATKKFTGEGIPEDKINQLKEMIKMSASSFGLQPYKIIEIKEQETKDKLMEASWNQPQINTCSHLLVFCSYPDIDKRIDQYEQMMKDAGVPEEHVNGYIGIMRGFMKDIPQEQRAIWAAKQAYIAVGNAINGAKAIGYDSCPMEGFDAAKYKEILGIDEELTPLVVVPVGIAADEPKPKLRYNDLFINK
jgi:nitroreductase/dihydropteridine reductase